MDVLVSLPPLLKVIWLHIRFLEQTDELLRASWVFSKRQAAVMFAVKSSEIQFHDQPVAVLSEKLGDLNVSSVLLRILMNSKPYVLQDLVLDLT